MNEKLTNRGLELATAEAKANGEWLVPSGKPQKLSSSTNVSEPYVPLLVRERDAQEMVGLLAAAPEAIGEVARLLDAVLTQGELIAAQAQELAVLRAEIKQLRKERVVAIVTKQMNDDILRAAERGVELDNYECRIELATTFDEVILDEQNISNSRHNGKQTTTDGNVEFANLLDILRGAKLGGHNFKDSLSKLEVAATRRTTSAIERSEDSKAHIKVERLRRK